MTMNEQNKNDINTSGRKSKVDIRLVYILPSILALALAITSFVFQFGNYIIDLQNTCYNIYLSVPQILSEEECVDCIESVLFDADITGFTILKNTQGGRIDEKGSLIEDSSYQIQLMRVSRIVAEDIAQKLQTAFNNSPVMIEETTIKITYLDGNNKAEGDYVA